mmetsp:Transcript_32194/g.81057  ORF Transcript_32194/g.81057 Transcript_32194/m.81057 type:complete len:261 (-) Transcript_32194:293-1075(-)
MRSSSLTCVTHRAFSSSSISSPPSMTRLLSSCHSCTLLTPAASCLSRSLMSSKPTLSPRMSLRRGLARKRPGFCPCCSALAMKRPISRSLRSLLVLSSLSSGSSAGNSPSLSASPTSLHMRHVSFSLSDASSAATFSKNLRVGPDPCPSSPRHVTSSTVALLACASRISSAHTISGRLSSCPACAWSISTVSLASSGTRSSGCCIILPNTLPLSNSEPPTRCTRNPPPPSASPSSGGGAALPGARREARARDAPSEEQVK